eukprot:CAMPEP_0194131942 /NCGR_PEP_ID=MMETSP0152-20130528/2550_1 /TAXON_ID=1049557 /ORGANISM="Thalassiothrix antarctica, Strain L6-D1" /LENGTH=1098 /DNA_ID=CAMNT_0038826841 /DNA_START=116 /DNA_END=3412 /DNA_ORIENTATION=-
MSSRSDLIEIFHTSPKQEEQERLSETTEKKCGSEKEDENTINQKQIEKNEHKKQQALDEVLEDGNTNRLMCLFKAHPGNYQHLQDNDSEKDIVGRGKHEEAEKKQRNVSLLFPRQNKDISEESAIGGHKSTKKCTSHQSESSESSSLMKYDFFPELTPSKRQYNSIPPPPVHKRMSSISESYVPQLYGIHSCRKSLTECLCNFTVQYLNINTFMGGFMFVLYHIVFCLAAASTIPGVTFGTMIMMTSSGVLFASPIFIYMLGDEIPAQYPSTDLFLAPFLAKLAIEVSDTLKDEGYDSNTQAFLATFSVLSSLGMLGSGILTYLASTFKLADLGSYLPYPVLCGFFTSVGILLWTLAISLDTGISVRHVLSSMENIQLTLIHHGPSLIAGCVIKIYGPRNPSFIIYAVGALMVLPYLIMWATNTNQNEAQLNKWFWSSEDLLSEQKGFNPPAPFALLFALEHVHWGAVLKGLKTASALSFLYFLRCSLHAPALKKSVPNLRKVVTKKKNLIKDIKPNKGHHRQFTEVVDIERSPFVCDDRESKHDWKTESSTEKEKLTKSNTEKNKLMAETIVINAENPTISMQKLLHVYACSQFIAAAVGSFAVTPSIASMSTMYSLGAEKSAPQYLSLILFLVFYLTNFELVAFIPKMAFSSLIVVSFLDMVITWGVKSYFKTKEKTEWLVVPLIVGFAFAVGLLQAVFLGIALSTFIFVAAFFRSGVVRYLSNGSVVRSTIERSIDAASWLDIQGDKIQIVVLQNYLFFGNASSMLDYISNMFIRRHGPNSPFENATASFPKYIILDLTLVTGMDTSTIDVFSTIKSICIKNHCKFFIAGLPSPLRAVLAQGGFKPQRGERSERSVRFFVDLDTAIGKAEDNFLLDNMMQKQFDPYNIGVAVSDDRISFGRALEAIDAQHGTDYAVSLSGLLPYTTTLHLEPEDNLYSGERNYACEKGNGLFFIASGIIKIERDSNTSKSRCTSEIQNSESSFGAVQESDFRICVEKPDESSTIRLARVGPGWVLGTLEDPRLNQFKGHHVALTKCILHHLPLNHIHKIEGENPVLALKLYKMLSYILTRRQEITIGQLVTLHSIMTPSSTQKPF